MKRTPFILITIILSLIFLSPNILAAPSAVTTADSTALYEIEFCGEADASEITSCAPAGLEDAHLFSESIYNCLANGMRNMESKIDISGYGISKNNLNTLNTYFGDTLLMNPDLYYVSPNYTYRYNGKGVITSISPKYLVTDKEEIASVQAQLENRIDEIISHTNDSMSDLEKLMTVHDKIVLSVCYDYSYQMTTAKELLLDGKSVCSGYTSALYAVATKLGIPCGLVRSQEMNHVWNSVYIDGAWFHVDMTWNDTAKEHSTTVSHEYFLKSNAWMANEGKHYGFIYISNDSTKYDNAFWHNADSQITSLGNNNMYFIDASTYYGSVSCYNVNTKEVSSIYTYDSLWPTGAASRYWLGAFSGLDVYDNRLYFNTWNEIMSCELDGSDVRVVFTAPEIANTSIYGCRIEGGKLYYVVGDKADPYSVTAQYCIDLPEIKKPESLVITSHENSMRVSDPMGIRYKASLEKESGATSFGWIVTRESLLKEAGIVVSDFVIDSNVLKAVGYNYGNDITTPKILDSDDNFNYFSMVLYFSDNEADGYPSAIKLAEKFVARPFVEIDGEMVYGETSKPVSIYNVALAICEDVSLYEALDEKAKQYVTEVVEKVAINNHIQSF